MTDRQKVLKEFPGSHLQPHGLRVRVVTKFGERLGKDAATNKEAWENAARFAAECPHHWRLDRLHATKEKTNMEKKNPAAVALGKMTSAARAAASRENGRKGGRPPKAQPETDQPAARKRARKRALKK